MTWHCPEWANNLDEQGASAMEEGEDTESLYDSYRCSSFYGSATVTVDQYDNTEETGETDSLQCSTHGREPEWHATPDFADEIDRFSSWHVCSEHQLGFSSEDYYLDHIDSHDEDEEDEGVDMEDTPQGRRARTQSIYGTPYVSKLHASWANPVVADAA